MLTAKESFMYTERWRMRSLQDNMSTCVYKCFLFLGKGSSQQKDDSFFFVWNSLNYRISEVVPSDILMGIRFIFPDGQTSIEQKHSLLCSFR